MKRLNDLENRVLTLEGAGLMEASNVTKKQAPKKNLDDFSGATGGVRLLISKGFFKTKREQATIGKELESHGYHYSRQAVFEALKDLSRIKGPLVVVKVSNHKNYAERK